MKKTDKTRRSVQLFFLSVSVVLFFLLITGILETAHAYCPYSAVCFGCLNLGQQLYERFFPGAVILGILLLVHAIFFGRRFCGYACPFGTIQELIYSHNPRAGKAKTKNLIAARLHKRLKLVKYAVLLGTAILAGLGLGYIYMQFCPVLSIAHIQLIRLAGIITLLVILGLSYFVERIWCNYLCPYAALLNLGQYLGKLLHLPRTRIKWSKSECIDCNLCDALCPMRIKIKEKAEIEDPECIYCHRCQLCCPVECKQRKE